MNWASSSPAAASATTSAAGPHVRLGLLAVDVDRRDVGQRQPLAQPHHARPQITIHGYGRPPAGRSTAITTRRAGRLRVVAQQVQRVLGGPGERDVLQLLLVALRVPLAQLGGDRVAARRRPAASAAGSGRSRASSGSVAGRYTRTRWHAHLVRSSIVRVHLRRY